MIIKFKTKGRPYTIDTEKEQQKIEKYLPKAKQRLKTIREKTSGYRSESVLGTSTTLPDWIETSLFSLELLEQGSKISLQEAKNIKQTTQSIKQLSSKQERVYGRSLEPFITAEYLSDIEELKKNSSTFAIKQLNRLEKNIKKLTARQRQKLYFSAGYQDLKTIYIEYEHIKTWAEKKSHKKEMTYQEAGFYLIAKRQEEGLDTLALEEVFNGL